MNKYTASIIPFQISRACSIFGMMCTKAHLFGRQRFFLSSDLDVDVRLPVLLCINRYANEH